MKPCVTLVDYGVGNLFSVSRALEYLGAEVLMAKSALDINNAERIILPGVGSFAHGMFELNKLGMVESLKAYSKTGRPFLGICLGMQLLFDESEEFGSNNGLGILPGKVVGIPSISPDGTAHKIPHIGWNELKLPERRLTWRDTILEGLLPTSSVYFVHSFSAQPAQQEYRLADCDYNGCSISAAVQSGSVIGCQFHPEKSGAVGLGILRRFIEMK